MKFRAGDMSILVGVAVFIALAICTLVIERLTDGPVNWFVARIFGGLGANRKKGIKGTWSVTYEYLDKSNKKHRVEQALQVRQVFSYVSATAISSTGPHLHQIQAKLEGRILTGTWRNMKEGTQHHGALQMVLSTHGDSLTGQWIGFDRRNRVQHGDYTWRLLSRDLGHVVVNVGTEQATANKELP